MAAPPPGQRPAGATTVQGSRAIPEGRARRRGAGVARTVCSFLQSGSFVHTHNYVWQWHKSSLRERGPFGRRIVAGSRDGPPDAATRITAGRPGTAAADGAGRQVPKGARGDAWASSEFERGTLRYVRGSCLTSGDPGIPEETQGTETSQYLEEKKSTETPLVAASERGPAQTEGVTIRGRGTGIDGRLAAVEAVWKNHQSG